MSSAATVYQILNLIAITCAALADSIAARRRGLDARRARRTGCQGCGRVHVRRNSCAFRIGMEYFSGGRLLHAARWLPA